GEGERLRTAVPSQIGTAAQGNVWPLKRIGTWPAPRSMDAKSSCPPPPPRGRKHDVQEGLCRAMPRWLVHEAKLVPLRRCLRSMHVTTLVPWCGAGKRHTPVAGLPD